MATKRIIDPISGRVIEVQVERDAALDAQTRRFEVAKSTQRSLGVTLDSRHASTMGAGKHTGNIGKAMQAREFKGACTNKAWRERRRQRDARAMAKKDKIAA